MIVLCFLLLISPTLKEECAKEKKEIETYRNWTIALGVLLGFEVLVKSVQICIKCIYGKDSGEIASV
jgi:hypothetical protein